MAIARANVGSNYENDGPAAITEALEVAASGGLLVAGTSWNGRPAVSMTYNGDAMTSDKAQVVAVVADSEIRVYSLVNPDTGTNDATFTRTGTAGHNALCVANYTGAKQSAQPDAVNSATSGSASSLSYTVTTTVDDCWIMSINQDFIGGGASSGTNFTILESPGNNANYGDSNGSVGAAGGKTVSVSYGSAGICALASAAYAPAPAAGPALVKTYNGTAAASVKTINGTAIASVKTYNGTA